MRVAAMILATAIATVSLAQASISEMGARDGGSPPRTNG